MGFLGRLGGGRGGGEVELLEGIPAVPGRLGGGRGGGEMNSLEMEVAAAVPRLRCLAGGRGGGRGGGKSSSISLYIMEKQTISNIPPSTPLLSTFHRTLQHNAVHVCTCKLVHLS